MRKSFHLQLKAGEQLFVNGAALRFDRRVSVEVMNDVTFLIGSSTLSAAEATTPLRQLYFMIQLPLIDPSCATNTQPAIAEKLEDLERVYPAAPLASGLAIVREQLGNGRSYEALKTLRRLFEDEDAVITAGVEPLAAASTTGRPRATAENADVESRGSLMVGIAD